MQFDLANLDIEGLNSLFPEKPKRNPIAAGLSSGVDSLQGLGYSALGGVSDAVGLDSARDWLNEQAARNALEAQQNGRPDLERIEDQSIGTALPYAAYQISKQVPLMGSIMAANLIPGVGQAATATGLARLGAVAPKVIGGGGLQAGANFAARRAALQAGEALASEAMMGTALGYGSLYGESVEGGDPSPFASAALAPFYGLAEAAVPAAVRGALRAPVDIAGNLGTRMLKAGGLGALGESSTELVQNEMEMALNGNVSPEEAFSRRLNSAVAGGIVGGPLGSLGGIRKPLLDLDDQSKPTNLLGGSYNLTTDMGALPPLQERINKNLGLTLPQGMNKSQQAEYAKLFNQAYNQPSGRRAVDPATGVERELTVGELLAREAELEQASAGDVGRVPLTLAPYGPTEGPLVGAAPSVDLETLRSDLGELAAMAEVAQRSGDAAQLEALNAAMRQTFDQIKALETQGTAGQSELFFPNGAPTYGADAGLPNLTTQLDPLQERIDQNLGLTRQGAPRNYPQQFQAAASEPTNLFAQDPATGREIRLDMGQASQIRAGDAPVLTQEQRNINEHAKSFKAEREAAHNAFLGPKENGVWPVDLKTQEVNTYRAMVALRQAGVMSQAAFEEMAGRVQAALQSNKPGPDLKKINKDVTEALAKVQQGPTQKTAGDVVAQDTKPTNGTPTAQAQQAAPQGPQVPAAGASTAAVSTQAPVATAATDALNAFVAKTAKTAKSISGGKQAIRAHVSQNAEALADEILAKASEADKQQAKKWMQDPEFEAAATSVFARYMPRYTAGNPDVDAALRARLVGSIQAPVVAPQGPQAPATAAPTAAVSTQAPVAAAQAPVEVAGTVKERVQQRLNAWAEQFPQMPKYDWLSNRELAQLEDLENRGELNLSALQTVVGKVAVGANEVTASAPKKYTPMDAPAVVKRLKEIVPLRPTDSNRPKDPTAAAVYDERMANYKKELPSRDDLRAALLHALITIKSPQIVSRLKLATGFDVDVENGPPRLIQVNNPAPLVQVAEYELSGGNKDAKLDPQKVRSLEASISKQLGKSNGFYQEVIDKIAANDAPTTISAAELGPVENGRPANYQTADTISEVTGTQLTESPAEHVAKRIAAELKLIAADNYSDEAIAAAYQRLAQIETRDTKASGKTARDVDETAGGRDELFDNREATDSQDATEQQDIGTEDATEIKANAYTDALAEALANRVLNDKKRARTRVALGDAKLDAAEQQKRKLAAIKSAVDTLRLFARQPGFTEAASAWNSLRSDKAPEFDQLPVVRQAAWVQTYFQQLRNVNDQTITREEFRWELDQEQRAFESGADFELESQLERVATGARNDQATGPDSARGKGSGPAAAESQDVGTRAKAKLKAAGQNVAKADLSDEELAWAIQTYEKLGNEAKVAEAKKVAESRQAVAAPAAEDRPVTPFVPRGVASDNEQETSTKPSQGAAQPQNAPVAGSTGQAGPGEQKESVGSRSEQADRGVPAAEVVADLKEFLRKDVLGRKVIVVQRAAELPKGIKVSSKSKTQGVAIDDGPYGRVAYLIADNLTRDNIRAVFMHEVGSHLALDNMLNTQAMANLIDQIKNWAKLGVNGSTKQEHVLAAKAARRVQKSVKNPSHYRSELLAYFIEEAVLDGITPTAIQTDKQSPLMAFLRKALALFKDIITELGVRPQDITAQDIVDLAYGAAQLEMADTGPIASGESLIRENAKFSKPAYMSKAPSELWETAQGAMAWLKDWTFTRGAFTRDLLNKAAELMPAAKTYLDEMQRARVESVKLEREVASIVDDASALAAHERGTGPRSINALIRQMTYENKWAFAPDWVKNVKPDTELAEWFDGLSKEAQAVVKRVFEHGHDSLLAAQRAAIDSIESEVNPLIDAARAKGDLETVKELEKAKVQADGKFRRLIEIRGQTPYAPLRRFGNWAVVVKSKMYQDAQARGDEAEMDRLSRDGNHYRVEFKSNQLSATARAKALQQELGDVSVQAFERGDDALLYGGESMFKAFSRFRNLAREKIGAVDPSGKQTKAEAEVTTALDKTLASMYMALVAETSARTSEFERKNVAGADMDMMRAFATQGRAMANFIGSLKTSGKIMDTLRTMKKQTYSGTNQAEKSKLYNEILRRHAMGLNYEPNQLLDKSLAANSYWSLITSPSYLLTNLTQPWVVSVPVLAGKFGLGRSSSEMMRAYKEIGRIATKLVDNPDAVKDLPKDVQAVVSELFNRGSIDISLGADLGSFTSGGESELSARTQKILRLPRTLAERGEMVNRVATAVAAYRLAKAQKMSTEDAINYADKVIYETHGDYSAFNSPRVMRNPVGRFATQFRKFQLIQIALYGRLIKDATKGLNPQERKAAQQALLYTLGTTFALGGLTAMPGYTAISFLAGSVLGLGDDDEPDDPEATLRRLLGGGPEADLILGGIPNLMGLNIGNRIGAAGMLSILPYTDLEASRDGYKDILLGLAGPFFGGTLPKALDGVGLISNGDYYKGLELLMPRGVADGLRGWRFFSEGVSKRNGDVTLSADEINFFEMALQAVGLPPKDITDNQMLRNSQFKADEFYKDRTSQLKRQYVEAYRDGDGATMQEVRQSWMETQDARRRLGIKVQPLSELLKAPQEQRKRESRLQEESLLLG